VAEYLPKLAKSTRDTDGSMIRVPIVPRWKDVKLANLRLAEVEQWIEGLTMATISKDGHAALWSRCWIGQSYGKCSRIPSTRCPW